MQGMNLAGPVEFGAEILVFWLLFLIVLPGLAIIGVVALLIAAKRYLAERGMPEVAGGKRRRSWQFLAIVGIVLTLPFIGWRIQDYLSYRRAVESRLRYLEDVGFVIYEPAGPPPGYEPDADVNPYRNPPYVEHHMGNGVVMTQFALSPGVERFLRVEGPCDPSGALMYLTLKTGPAQPPGYAPPGCRLLFETPDGHLVHGPGAGSDHSGRRDVHNLRRHGDRPALHRDVRR